MAKCCSNCQYYYYDKERPKYKHRCAWNKFFDVDINPEKNVCHMHDRKVEG